MPKVKLFEYVKETTKRASERGVVERSKAAERVKAETQETYDKIASPRLDLHQEDLGSLMGGVSARSWHTVKAALLHVSAQRYIAARRACDVAQKSGDLRSAAIQARIARRAVAAIDRIQTSERPALTKRRATKRRTLPRSEDWQSRAYDAATPAQKPAVAIMWAAGARPREVETGVLVEKVTTKRGDVYLGITITGAKSTETSGQPIRQIAIDALSAAGVALLEQMGGEEKIVIQRGAKRMNKDFKAIREKTGLKISPYSLRHQFGANLKAHFGADGADQVAAAMGHATTRSQGRYGSVRQAQSGDTGIAMVKASRPVKETRSGPKKTGPDAAASFSDGPG